VAVNLRKEKSALMVSVTDQGSCITVTLPI